MSQLLSCYNDWRLSRNSSKVSDVIFLDLSTPFDSVPHKRLLLKLNRYGIHGQLYLWFRNFLANRKQRVQIRGSYSERSPVVSGVPQGSILRPILFLIYVSDIPNIIISIAKLFASKCEVMRITHNKDKSTTRYQVSGTKLRNVSSYKDLGVIMASDLTWTKHVEETVHKANKVLGLLKRTVGSKKKAIFSILCKTLVRPILEYASPAWSPHPAKDIHEIGKVQRRASRITLGQRRQKMAYENRSKILQWNSLERRREFLSLLECYEIV